MRSSNEIIVWSEARPVFERRLRAAVRELGKAEDLRQIGYQQGKIAVLEELMDFPTTLEQILAEEQEAAEEVVTHLSEKVR